VDELKDEFEGNRRQMKNQKALKIRGSVEDLEKKLDAEYKTQILKTKSIINNKITDAMVLHGIPPAEATKYHLTEEKSWYWFW